MGGGWGEGNEGIQLFSPSDVMMVRTKGPCALGLVVGPSALGLVVGPCALGFVVG